MENLAVTLVQSHLHWEDKLKNFEHLTHLIQSIEQTDIIVLPEMFTTGFSMSPELFFEEAGGETHQWMHKIAQEKQAIVTGSTIVRQEGKYFNRLIWMSPNGEYQTYDKRHLFSLAGEHNHYSRGEKRLIIEVKGWKICPLICYDLRFPVWSRNNEEIDVYIYTANWPEKRSFHWKSLLVARAIENQAFVVGVNRVGEDGNGMSHTGDSVVLDPLGGALSELTPSQEQIVTISLPRKTVEKVRERFKFLDDQDQFSILG